MDDSGVVCGQENNQDLFIRKTVFEVGYTESEFHSHPNSYEFYFILEGGLSFANETEEISATKGSIVYFQEAEPHKITKVNQKTTMLLIKKIGAIKNQDTGSAVVTISKII